MLLVAVALGVVGVALIGVVVWMTMKSS
jgi:hypothetical protein